ncbi:MAG: hypothetical protein K9L84_00020 [Candidatus Omnitrophica bacterium]|nr:hypothetical protein [Candidatus Omnitrophota bacterium]MCF7893436.1 hypothetical protein [Candidatus Omnitrophota bacterium]
MINKKKYKYSKLNWPVPAKELKKRYESCRREENRVSAIWLVLFFMFLFGCIALGDFVESLSRTIEIVLIVFFMGGLVGNLFFIFKTIKDRMRDYGLVCPNCKKVFNVKLINYVLNTGHCYRCGAKLVE